MMSTRTSLLSAARVHAGRQAAAVRGFSFSTSRRLGLKESASQSEVDYDKHKQDSLAKQKKGSGHWKPELASDSEEAVRADRLSGVDAKTLQERTKRAAEETSKAGTSMRDGL